MGYTPLFPKRGWKTLKTKKTERAKKKQEAEETTQEGKVDENWRRRMLGICGGGMDWKGNAGGRGSVERFATIMHYFTD
jgi:hypothetical protein